MTAPIINVIDGGYVLAAVWTNDDRPNRLPLATAVLSAFGWAISTKDDKRRFTQEVFTEKSAAVSALRYVATRRAVGAR